MVRSNAYEFRSSTLAKLKFPLLLKSVEQVDSKLSSGVQLADILVGGIIDAAKSASGVKVNSYNEQILPLYRENQLIHLLPNIDFEENKVFRKGAQASEMIDYFAKNFSG